MPVVLSDAWRAPMAQPGASFMNIRRQPISANVFTRYVVPYRSVSRRLAAGRVSQ
jgi:hypothetical protein